MSLWIIPSFIFVFLARNQRVSNIVGDVSFCPFTKRWFTKTEGYEEARVYNPEAQTTY